MMRKFYTILLACAISVFCQNWTKIYNEGLELINARQPSSARLKFEQVRKSPVNLGLLDNAEYWIAVSYFDEKRFEEAIKHYRKAQALPDGNKAGAAQFELALSFALMGDTATAVMEYYKILTLYPNEGLDERALAKIDSLKGPNQPNIPDKGPITPALANRIAKEKPATAHAEHHGMRIETSGPLAGTEIPVPRKVKPATTKERVETGETIENQIPEPRKSESESIGEEQKPEEPATKPVQPSPPKNIAPETDDPRNLIKPEEKIKL